MKTRRHHNNKGTRQIRRGKTREQAKRLAKKLGIKFTRNTPATVRGWSGPVYLDNILMFNDLGSPHEVELLGKKVQYHFSLHYPGTPLSCPLKRGDILESPITDGVGNIVIFNKLAAAVVASAYTNGVTEVFALLLKCR